MDFQPTSQQLDPLPADGLGAIPMAAQDAWLHRKHIEGTVCTTIAGVAWFEGTPPTATDLRNRAHQRFQQFPRLRRMSYASEESCGLPGRPQWVDAGELDVPAHVAVIEDGGTVESIVGRLITCPLDPNRPPWRLLLIPRRDGFAIVMLTHHALLDGMSLLVVLYSLLDQFAEGIPQPAAEPSSAWDRPSRRQALAWSLGDLLPKGRPLPLHRTLGDQREVAFSHMSRELLAKARHALDADSKVSNTAVYLAAVAGGLRDLGLAGRHPRIPGACAMVPVDVRPPEQAALMGNHYGIVRIPLPTHRDPHERLAAVERRIRKMDLRKRARSYVETLSSRPHRTTWLDRAVDRYIDTPWYFSLMCTSASGLVGQFTMAGARLGAISGVPPLVPNHPLAVTMVRHNDGATLSIVTDPALHRAEPLAGAIGEHIRLLADDGIQRAHP
ncbi:wax ester/triacylglycerol synthase domain-containing protein [Streptomyces sp. KS 21]|uniref:wax ester/triacylglycerol synthase domain-containing protein n=1 Tax=Streptomyces sp. KS 21 TaxID=2485150 RepID=UPI0010625C07|nr:wax ester/triacylglycerol synthase domain-containing protein [Streptomyces sp. KS 21]TDU73565.1 uncharacterized protein DUF1298 [Streptomyces sp. KS 21]